MSEWISVDEKMPEFGKTVMIAKMGKYVTTATYTQWKCAKTERGRRPRFEDLRGIVDNVTHWQPLPEPPK